MTLSAILGMPHRDRLSGSHREMRQMSLTLLFRYTVHARLARMAGHAPLYAQWRDQHLGCGDGWPASDQIPIAVFLQTGQQFSVASPTVALTKHAFY